MPSIKKNFFYNVLLTLGQVLVPLLILPHVSNVLSTEGIGVVSFTESTTLYFSLIAALGIPIYGVREIAKCKSKEERDIVFGEIFALYIISTLFFLIVYIAAIFSIRKMYDNVHLFYLGLIYYASLSFTFEWFFQGAEKYKFITLRTLGIKVVTCVLIFVLVRNKDDVFTFFLITVSGGVINAIVNIFYLRKVVTLVTVTRQGIKRHLKGVFSLFVTRFVISIYVLLLNAIIGLVSVFSANAFFSAAYKIYMAVLTVIISYNTVLIPKMTQSFTAESYEETDRHIANALRFIKICAIPCAFLLFYCSDNIIYILLGPSFSPTIADLKILSPLVFFISLSNFFALNILTPMHKEKYYLYAVTGGMIVSLLINIPLIKAYADMGAAIGLLSVECLISYLLYYFSKKAYSFKIGFLNMLMYILLTVPFYLFNVLSKHYFTTNVLQLICLVTLCCFYWIFVQIFLLKNISYKSITGIVKQYLVKKEVSL